MPRAEKRYGVGGQNQTWCGFWRREAVTQSETGRADRAKLMESGHAYTPTTQDEVIQIRASTEAKALLNRAAALRGQKLSEFMLESARREAEETVLDQRIFFLDEKAHAHFLALLDSPPRPSAELRALFNRKAPWER